MARLSFEIMSKFWRLFKKKKSPLAIQKPPTTFLSSTHPVSNLRLVRLVERKQETNYEREYRLKWEELQRWNQWYWEANNATFQKAKAAHIEKLSSVNKDEDLKTPLDLSSFYKEFLEENYRRHISYNKLEVIAKHLNKASLDRHKNIQNAKVIQSILASVSTQSLVFYKLEQ